MLKIMHTESHRQWGGQERRVFSECRWMHRRGHHPVIAAPLGSPLYEKSRQQGWETHDIGFTKPGMPKDAAALRRLFRRLRPDVLNTHGNTDSKVALCAAWGLKIPCVIRTRHSTPPVGNSWYNRLLYRKLCHFIFTTANCITDQLSIDLDIPIERIATIPSGIDCPTDLIDRDAARKRVAGEIGVAGDRRFIGFVGRLSTEKGLGCLIDAYAAIRERISSYHLVIVGEGDILTALKAQIRSAGVAGAVHLLGYRDDPWPYFRAFDCHILASSQFEGVPQVLLQAMFAECPVIGTRAGGIPDIVEHGKTGLLVPPDNPSLLAEAILRTLQEPQSTLDRVREAYRYVVDNHTVDAMGERILSVYKRRLSI